jgi:hypothetical protein
MVRLTGQNSQCQPGKIRTIPVMLRHLIVIFTAMEALSAAGQSGNVLVAPYLRPATQAPPMTLALRPDGRTTELATDANGDGRPDIVDSFFAGEGIRERREDTNFDGVYDKFTRFPSGPGERLNISSDTNGDGKADLIEERWLENGRVMISRKMDVKFTGKFGKPQIETLALKEAFLQEPNADENDGSQLCEIHPGFTKQLRDIDGIKDLFIGAITGGAAKGFRRTNFGFQIEESCFRRFAPENVTKLLADTLRTGVACLWRLNTAATRVNAHKIASLLLDSEKPPQLICNDEEFWRGNSAIAIGHPGGYFGAKVPRISINPQQISDPEHSNKWPGTIFHEIFHTTGYMHHSDIEFPYSCETCCFGDETGSDKEVGCKLCKGEYGSVSSKEHIQDAVHLYRQIDRSSIGRELVRRNFVKDPNDRWNHLALATSHGDEVTLPLAIAFKESFIQSHPSLTEEETLALEKLKAPDQESYFQRNYPPAKAAAEAFVAAQRGDLKAAEQALRNFKPLQKNMGRIPGDMFLEKEIEKVRSDAGWTVYVKYRDSGKREDAIRIFDEFLRDEGAEAKGKATVRVTTPKPVSSRKPAKR